MANNLTDNKNFLSPGAFKVTIDSSEFANLQFFCTNAAVPGISQPSVIPGFRNINVYMPGDTIEYSTMELTFIVDEEMKNYTEIHSWLITNTTDKPKFKDVTLSILSNKNTTNKQFRFHNAFPIDLGQLSFTTQDTAVEYVTCTVTLQYNKFDIVR